MSISRFFSSFTRNLSTLVFFFVAPPHMKKKMDHQASRMIGPQNLEIPSRNEGWSTDQLHNGTCDDDSPVQLIWRDEACGVTSRCQIVQKPHNEGCINLLNDRAGPARGEPLCDEVTRTHRRSRVCSRVFKFTWVPGWVTCTHALSIHAAYAPRTELELTSARLRVFTFAR